MKGHFWRFVMAFLCLVATAAATSAIPFALQHTLDGIFTAKNADLLMPISIAVVVIFFVRGASTYGFTVVMNSIGRRIVAELQMRMFSRKIWDDLASFHATASGHLVSQFIYNVQAVMGAVSTSAASIGRDATTLIGLLVAMFYMDWRLAVVASITFPLSALPVIKVGRDLRKVTRKSQFGMGELTSYLTQVFQGIRHVKAYNAEQRTIKATETFVQAVSQAVAADDADQVLQHPVHGGAVGHRHRRRHLLRRIAGDQRQPHHWRVHRLHLRADLDLRSR